jgi:hypothetical protein
MLAAACSSSPERKAAFEANLASLPADHTYDDPPSLSKVVILYVLLRLLWRI